MEQFYIIGEYPDPVFVEVVPGATKRVPKSVIFNK